MAKNYFHKLPNISIRNAKEWPSKNTACNVCIIGQQQKPNCSTQIEIRKNNHTHSHGHHAQANQDIPNKIDSLQKI
jgi:hypothetical protein